MIRVRTPAPQERIPLRPETPPAETDETTIPAGIDRLTAGTKRAKKVLFANRQEGGRIDESIVSPRFYNGFNYTLEQQHLIGSSLVIGVTSANAAEGKTLVAANFAVSLALSTERKTVLVDLHLSHPQLHAVFGVPPAPGLLESLSGESIELWETHVPQLHLITAGSARVPRTKEVEKSNGESELLSRNASALRLDDLGGFRDVLASLKEVFEFVVLDLPPLRSNSLPTVFTGEIHQFIAVVLKESTRKEDLDALVRRIDDDRLLGFVVTQSASARVRRPR